ncbi:MAG TPA: GAF domain-containing sensor histidine kinase, partial [Chloroflexota bacterium]|nr:GAF domain-containing sensor histidine kinase [Chloroflexota bacterium]
TGSGLLATAILIAGFRAAFPGIIPPLSLLGGPLGLASGVAFYLGFATPRWVLRSWREPELLAFLDGADQLAAQSDVAGLLHELQSAVSGALGLRGAFVGLWHEDENVLEYGATRFTAEQIRGTDARLSIEGELLRTPVDVLIGGQCFVSQKPIYTENVEDLDPEHAGLYRALGVKVVIVAPMTVGSERYGVLGVFAPRTRLFAEDSLTRVQMLARNAAILLRSRRLLERAASVRVQEEVVRQKEDFLSSATHDLKTPLTSIKGVAQWIRRRASSDEAIDGAALESDLLRIENAAARMGGLIDEVLDISRLQMSRPLELQMDTTDLTALARKVAERQQEMTSRHRIEVQSAESVMGCWDQARLERVIDNLLSNAVKFSPQGGAVTVEVERESGEWAVLTVRDEGIGMRPGDAERIFGRFERGTNAAERGITGTGIGLSYVRQIVAAHGGEVSVQSADGAGSTFTVKLPVQNVPCAASKPQSESEEKASI